MGNLLPRLTTTSTHTPHFKVCACACVCARQVGLRDSSEFNLNFTSLTTSVQSHYSRELASNLALLVCHEVVSRPRYNSCNAWPTFCINKSELISERRISGGVAGFQPSRFTYISAAKCVAVRRRLFQLYSRQTGNIFTRSALCTVTNIAPEEHNHFLLLLLLLAESR